MHDATTAGLPHAIDWPGFLARQDPIWDRLPTRWEDAAMAGGGLVGALLFASADGSRLHCWLGRSDVGQLDRPLLDPDHGQTTPPGGPGVHPPSAVHETGTPCHRRPIGSMDLLWDGGIDPSRSSMRIDLWRAEIRMTVQTATGSCQLRCWCPSGGGSVVLEWQGPAPRWQPALVDEAAHIDTTAGTAVVPDRQLATDAPAGGGHALAWRSTVAAAAGRLCIGIGAPPQNRACWDEAADAGDALSDARRQLEAIADLDQARLAHRAWWAEHLRHGFLSLPDPEAESLYWIQRYVFASATRGDRPMCDNHGPWCTMSRYGFATWDMNVQAIHQLYLRADVLECGAGLTRFLDRYFCADRMRGPDGLLRAGLPSQRTFLRVPSERIQAAGVDGAALLLWACHNDWCHARTTRDEAHLLRLLDRLDAGIRAMQEHGSTDDEGRLHLRGRSWESWTGTDPNCVLACLRWALQTAIGLGEHFDRPVAHWRTLLQRLPSYAQDERHGLLIAPDVPPAPHRHWSHLMMCLPFDEWHPDHPAAAVLQRSIGHWSRLSCGLDPDRPLTAGFAAAAAISMHARFDEGATVARLLDQALHGSSRFGFPNLWAGTLYREMGPVIESPLLLARALQDLLVQCWNGRVHLFRGLPPGWRDCCCAGLRSDDGFLIDAVRRDGRSHGIAIRNPFDRAATCRLQCDLPTVSCTGAASISSDGTGGHDIVIPAQARALLLPPDGRTPTIHACAQGAGHPFGLNERFLARRAHLRPWWPETDAAP